MFWGQRKQRSKNVRQPRQAQAALEYMILLGAVTVVVLLAFNTLLTKHRQESEGYFNAVARGVYGPAVVYNENGNWIDRARKNGYYP